MRLKDDGRAVSGVGVGGTPEEGVILVVYL